MTDLEGLRTSPVFKGPQLPRRAVTHRGMRAQTYRVSYRLACGHESTYTVSAARRDDPKAHPKTFRCGQCPHEDGCACWLCSK